MDFFLISAAVSAAIVAVIIIVYLIVANTRGLQDGRFQAPPSRSRSRARNRRRRRARAWAVDDPEQIVSWDSVVVVSQLQPQS